MSPLARVFAPYRDLDRRIWILAAARAVNTMGFSIVMPFMALYLVERRGTTGATYGLIYLVAGLTSALGNAVAGELADRLGRRRLMVSALVARAANMVAIGTAVLFAAPVWSLATLIVVNSVLRSMFEPAASASVTELSPVARRTAVYGLQRIGVNLGWALGPAIGGALAVAHRYGTLFFVAAAIILAATVAVARIHDLPRPRREEPAGALTLGAIGEAYRRNPPFFVYLGLVFLGATMTVQLFATLSVFARTELGLHEAAIGLLYTVNGVLVVVLQVPAVTLIDRAGAWRALVFGPLLYAVGFVAIGLADGLPALILAMTILTAGEVVFAPALSDTAARLGDPRRLGRAFGLVGLVQQLGLSAGPLVGGLAYDHLRSRPLAMWGTLASVMLFIGAGYAAFARRHRARLGRG